jgi:dUTP pyrophosphatase
MPLNVKKFHEDAILPTVTNPGTDLGYDLYTVEEVVLAPGEMKEVRTGIGVEFTGMAVGFVVKDRSSMAKRRLVVSGGVIDAGYRGEIIVFLENRGSETVTLTKGQKFAQMLSLPPLTRLGIVEVDELTDSARGVKGFGSSDEKRIITV